MLTTVSGRSAIPSQFFARKMAIAVLQGGAHGFLAELDLEGGHRAAVGLFLR
jgi:hypothetical protein